MSFSTLSAISGTLRELRNKNPLTGGGSGKMSQIGQMKWIVESVSNKFYVAHRREILKVNDPIRNLVRCVRVLRGFPLWKADVRVPKIVLSSMRHALRSEWIIPRKIPAGLNLSLPAFMAVSLAVIPKSIDQIEITVRKLVMQIGKKTAEPNL